MRRCANAPIGITAYVQLSRNPSAVAYIRARNLGIANRLWLMTLTVRVDDACDVRAGGYTRRGFDTACRVRCLKISTL